MSKTRIYVDMPLLIGEAFSLDAAPANHLANVLRREAGDAVVLFNGLGGEYHGCLSQVKKKDVRVKLDTFIDENRASPLRVHLGQVMIKGERMDYALQKATELGVREITPLVSERCEVRLKGERLEKKVSHWQRVVQSACEQCQSNLVPKVNMPQSVQSWLAQREETLRWVCHPRLDDLPAEQGSIEPASSTQSVDSAALFIGAEGGLTNEEVRQACEHHFIPQLFGPRVLRAETAPVVALSLLQMRFGDY
jgi:16S rRNA (uracil1498-N3)-methyltransferase